VPFLREPKSLLSARSGRSGLSVFLPPPTLCGPIADRVGRQAVVRFATAESDLDPKHYQSALSVANLPART
jgi:hypothetical protein